MDNGLAAQSRNCRMSRGRCGSSGVGVLAPVAQRWGPSSPPPPETKKKVQIAYNRKVIKAQLSPHPSNHLHLK